MINLDEGFVRIDMSGCSKGNQPKYYYDGCWVKLDTRRSHEGLAEHFVSCFEDAIQGFNFVHYDVDTVLLQGQEYRACYSRSMYGNRSVCFVSLRDLLERYDRSPHSLVAMQSCRDNISVTVDFIHQVTGVDTLSYFRDCLFLDSLIINEDRHYMNLGVCYNGETGAYSLAPVFDNGASLFQVIWTYRPSKSLEMNLQSAKTIARPFSKFYHTQVEALLELGCQPLVINKAQVDFLLNTYSNQLYPAERVELCKKALYARLQEYEGLSFVWA